MKKRIINQKIADKFVRCYDNGGHTCDRYTAVYIGRYRQRDGHGQLSWFQHCCMSECPFHPQGVGMHGENPTQIDVAPGSWGPISMGRKNHLGIRIPFRKLPVDCRRLVVQDLKEIWS